MNVIDLNTIEALRELQEEGESDLLAELIDLFLQDAPERIASMRSAVDGGDWTALAERAHSLKGSCSSLGAVHMAGLCAQLEAMGRDRAERADAATVQSALEQQYALVQAALERERNAPTH
jgi:HPt (histidine-containing phosphotransfer) domain-containing protein